MTARAYRAWCLRCRAETPHTRRHGIEPGRSKSRTWATWAICTECGNHHQTIDGAATRASERAVARAGQLALPGIPGAIGARRA